MNHAYLSMAAMTLMALTTPLVGFIGGGLWCAGALVAMWSKWSAGYHAGALGAWLVAVAAASQRWLP